MEVREPAAEYDHLFSNADELRSPDGETDGSCRLGEWREVSFDEAFSFSGGLSASRAQLGKKGHLYLHYGDIHSAKGSFVDLSRDLETIPRLDVSLREVPTASLLEDGDVVFVDASEDAEGASKHVVVLNPDKVPFVSGLHTIVAKRKTDALLPIFAGYCFQSDEVKRQFQFFAAGTKVLGVSKTNIRKIRLRIPPPLEQKGIGGALFNVDALIQSLEQLLAKKRQIKQGVMQELLTGKRRLPGFSNAWRRTTLGELGFFLKGSGVSRAQAQSGDLPCVRYGELYTTHHEWIRNFTSSISLAVAAEARQLKKGDVLFAASGETKAEIGKCAALVDDVVSYAGGDIVVLRPHNADSLFLGYALNAPAVCAQKASRGQGDAVVHISSAALGSIEIELPEPEEQQAIAAVLFDIDAEITALEARLAKTRELKQGMMQVLLTGAIHLT